MVADKQIAIVEQFGDPLLQPFGLTVLPLLCRRLFRPSARQLRYLRLEPFSHLGYHLQHGFGQFLENVEFADLMGNIPKNLANRHGIQRRAIRGDAANLLAAGFDFCLQPGQKPAYVVVRGFVVEHFKNQAALLATVHRRQDTKRTVVQFIHRQVAGELGQGPIQIAMVDFLATFFFRRPQPSFGSWRKAQTRAGPAISARTLDGTASRPPPPDAPPRKPPGGCIGPWVTPGRKDRHRSISCRTHPRLGGPGPDRGPDRLALFHHAGFSHQESRGVVGYAE